MWKSPSELDAVCEVIKTLPFLRRCFPAPTLERQHGALALWGDDLTAQSQLCVTLGMLYLILLFYFCVK